MNDNRNYEYAPDSQTSRAEFKEIFDLVEAGSRVLDLGCGDGSLLKSLQKKKIRGIGLDISPTAVKSARRKGVTAFKGRIDKKLPYPNNSFDYSICCVTIQMVMYPDILLSEMVRVSKRQIVSFPNFAFILNRLDLLFNGRFPRFTLFGYNWYSTGHIHQFSIRDFEEYIERKKVKKIMHHPFIFSKLGAIPGILLAGHSNLWASSAVYLLEK